MGTTDTRTEEQKFRDNFLSCLLNVTDEEMAGLPEDLLTAARASDDAFPGRSEYDYIVDTFDEKEDMPERPGPDSFRVSGIQRVVSVMDAVACERKRPSPPHDDKDLAYAKLLLSRIESADLRLVTVDDGPVAVSELRSANYLGPWDLSSDTEASRMLYKAYAVLSLRMHDIMSGIRSAVGLAAPQLGIPLPVFVTNHDGNTPRTFIDPSLSVRSPLRNQGLYAMEPSVEGCLSIPEKRFTVARYRKIWVSHYEQVDGTIVLRDGEELSGFLAKVVQHEYDHTVGVLISDRAAQSHTKKVLSLYGVS